MNVNIFKETHLASNDYIMSTPYGDYNISATIREVLTNYGNGEKGIMTEERLRIFGERLQYTLEGVHAVSDYCKTLLPAFPHHLTQFYGHEINKTESVKSTKMDKPISKKKQTSPTLVSIKTGDDFKIGDIVKYGNEEYFIVVIWHNRKEVDLEARELDAEVYDITLEKDEVSKIGAEWVDRKIRKTKSSGLKHLLEFHEKKKSYDEYQLVDISTGNRLTVESKVIREGKEGVIYFIDGVKKRVDIQSTEKLEGRYVMHASVNPLEIKAAWKPVNTSMKLEYLESNDEAFEGSEVFFEEETSIIEEIDYKTGSIVAQTHGNNIHTYSKDEVEEIGLIWIDTKERKKGNKSIFFEGEPKLISKLKGGKELKVGDEVNYGRIRPAITAIDYDLFNVTLKLGDEEPIILHHCQVEDICAKWEVPQVVDTSVKKKLVYIKNGKEIYEIDECDEDIKYADEFFNIKSVNPYSCTVTLDVEDNSELDIVLKGYEVVTIGCKWVLE